MGKIAFGENMVSESITMKYGQSDDSQLELWEGLNRIPGTKIHINTGFYGANQGIRIGSFEKDTGNDEPTLGQGFVTSEEADFNRVSQFGRKWQESKIDTIIRYALGKEGHVPFKPFIESLEIGDLGNAKDPSYGAKQILSNNSLTDIKDFVMKIHDDLLGRKPSELCFSTSKQGGTGELVRLVLMHLFSQIGWDDIPFNTNITAIRTRRLSEQEQYTSKLQIAYCLEKDLSFTNLQFLTDDSNLAYSRLQNELVIDQGTLDDLVAMSITAIHAAHKRFPETLEASDVLKSLMRQSNTKIVVPMVLSRAVPIAWRTLWDRIRKGKSNKVYDVPEKRLEQELSSAFISLKNNPKSFMRAEISDEEIKSVTERSIPVAVLGGYVNSQVVLSAWERSKMPSGWSPLPLPYPARHFSVVAWCPVIGEPMCFSKIFGYHYDKFREVESARSIVPKPIRMRYANKFRPILGDLLSVLRIEETEDPLGMQLKGNLV